MVGTGYLGGWMAERAGKLMERRMHAWVSLDEEASQDWRKDRWKLE